MEGYYFIKTEKGQSLYDISVQEYGDVKGIWWILQDNDDVLPDGVCSVMPAGKELKIRKKKPERSDIQKYFRDQNIIVNTNIDDELVPEEPIPPPEQEKPIVPVIIIEPGESEIIEIAPENAEAVFLNYLIKKDKILTDENENTDEISTDEDTDENENTDEISTDEDTDENKNTDEISTDENTDENEIEDEELQKNIKRYVGTMRIVNDFVEPLIADDEYSSNERHNIGIEVLLAEGYISLKITAPTDARVYFKKHVITIL